MIVVADATILIRLGRIGRLELLRELYGSIVVPQRVWEEITVDGRGRPGSTTLEEAHRAGWVTVQAPANQADVDSLQRFGGLDLGERQALVIAIDLTPSLLLIDEGRGYSIVRQAFSRYVRAASLLHVLDEVHSCRPDHQGRGAGHHRAIGLYPRCGGRTGLEAASRSTARAPSVTIRPHPDTRPRGRSRPAVCPSK